MTNEELKPFTTDGCSDCGVSKLFWLFGKTVPERMHLACVEHDRAYWAGGTYADRKAADKVLRQHIANIEPRDVFRRIAQIYYVGVRIGGCQYWPTPWRWGYGHRWPRA